MPYTQRFSARGNDLETLNYFRENVLAADVEDPSEQQLVASRVYDAVRTAGVPEHGSTLDHLTTVYNAVKSGDLDLNAVESMPVTPKQHTQIGQTIAQAWDEVKASGYSGTPAMQANLPSVPMGMPLETMRPARYLNSGDAVADSAGAFAWHFIDSLSLGTVGMVGGLLKRMGVTDENFWTETIGEAQDFMGMDFGEGGVKGGDTTAGKWFSAAGELTGFIAPAIVTGGAGLAARGFKAGAAGARRSAQQAAAKGLTKTAAGATAKAARLTKAAEKTVEAGAKAGEILSKAPATQVFKQAHRILDSKFMGQAGKKFMQRVFNEDLAKVTVRGLKGWKGATFTPAAASTSGAIGLASGVLRPGLPGANPFIGMTLAGAREAYRKGGKAGLEAAYKTARQQSPAVMRELTKGLKAADVEKAILENPDVRATAQSAFVRIFQEKAFKELGLSAGNQGHRTMVHNLSQQALGLFDDALMGARKTGLLALHEKAFAKGARGLTVGAAKLAEEAANHVTGMMALGLVTRVSHPFAEPDVYGIDEDDFWEASKGVAKYWLKGSGGSPFEGVLGDMMVGSMFATGAGLKLLKPFQKRQIENPQEVLSILAGGNAGEWKQILDHSDNALGAMYKMINEEMKMSAKNKTRNPFKMIRRAMKQNRVDFEDLLPGDNGPGSVSTLKVVAKEYLRKIRALEAAGLAPATLGKVGFTEQTVEMMGRDPEKAKMVARLMNGHLENVFRHYQRGHAKALLRDISGMATVTLATSYATAPEMWKETLKGNPDLHISQLVVHSIFAGLMARQPYYAQGGSPFFANRDPGQPMSAGLRKQLSLNRAKDLLRHMGVRDHAMFLDGGEAPVPGINGSKLDPRASSALLNDAASATREGKDGNIKRVKAELVPDNQRVVGREQLTHTELTEGLKYIASEYADHKRAGQLEQMDKLLLPEGEEAPLWVQKGELSGDPVQLTDAIETIVRLRQKLRDAGHIEPDGAFDKRSVNRMNTRWLEQAVSGFLKAGYDVYGELKRDMAEGTDATLEYMRIVDKSGQPSENADLRATEAAYTELLDIIRDLNLGKDIKVNDAITPEAAGRQLIVEFEGDKMVGDDADMVRKMNAHIRNMEQMIEKRFGLEEGSFRLGDKTALNLLKDALFEVPLDHASMFSLDGAVLPTIDKEAFDLDSVKNAVTEQGIGMYDEKTGTLMLRPINEKVIEGTHRGLGGEPVDKLQYVHRLYSWLKSHPGVKTMSLSRNEDMALTQAHVDAIFGRGRKWAAARQAGPGRPRSATKDGIFQLLTKVGIPLENETFTEFARMKNIIDANKDLSDLDISMTAEFARADLVKVINGQETVALPAQGTRDQFFELKGDLLGSMANAELTEALTREQFDAMREILGRLVDAGVYSPNTLKGFDIESREIDGGLVRAYGTEDIQPKLEGLVKALDFYNGVRTGEFIEGLDLMAVGLNKAMNNKNISKPLRGTMKKLLVKLSQVKDGNYAAWRGAWQMMREDGSLFTKDKKGFKKEFKIQSNKQLRSMLDKLDANIDASFKQEAEAFDAIDRNNARDLLEEHRHLLHKKPGEVSITDVMNDLGLYDLRTARNEVYTQNKTMYEADAGGELATNLRQILADNIIKYYGESTTIGKDLMDRLAIYNDATLRNISDMMATQVPQLAYEARSQLVIDREVDQFTKPNGTIGVGRAKYMVSDEGNFHRGTHSIEKRLVQRNVDTEISENLGMPVSILSGSIYTQRGPKNMFDNADIYQAQRELAFSGSIIGVEQDVGRGITVGGGEDRRRMVIIENLHESGGGRLLHLPHRNEQREAFADGMDRITQEYRGEWDSLPVKLKALIAQYEHLSSLMRDERLTLEDLYNGYKMEGDARVEDIGRYQNKMTGFTSFFEFARYHHFLSPSGVIGVYEKSTRPSENPWPEVNARMRLSANQTMRRFSDRLYNEGWQAYTRGSGRLGPGVEIGSDGRIKGEWYLIADDKGVGEKRGHNKVLETDDAAPLQDGAIVRHSLSMGASAEGMGQSTRAGGPNAVEGLAKFGFDHADGDWVLKTKALALVDLSFEPTLEASNVAGFINRSAIKVLFRRGMLDPETNATVFEEGIPDGEYANVGGEKDIWRLQSENPHQALQLEGRRVFIPVKSFRSTHAIDAHPAEAAKSLQLSNMKPHTFVKSMIDRDINSMKDEILAVFEPMTAGFSTGKQMASHALFNTLRERMSMEEMDRYNTRAASAYMEHGGALASPSHYGQAEYYLDVLKKSVLEDKLFKLRTDKGSAGVYTADMKGVLTRGNTILPASARETFFYGEDTMVGYAAKHLTPEQIEEYQQRSIGHDQTLINRQGTGEATEGIAPDAKTDVIYVPLVGAKGNAGGVSTGLEFMWYNRGGENGSKSRPPRWVRYEGDTLKLEEGATTLHKIFTGDGLTEPNMKVAAAAINDAFQILVDSPRAADHLKAANSAADDIMNLFPALSAEKKALWKQGIVDDLTNSRARAAANMIPSSTTERNSLWETDPRGGPDVIRHGVLHDMMEHLFGSYDYYSRVRGEQSGLGSQTFGLGVVAQRHPSTMSNDTLPQMALGFRDRREGNQITIAASDAERKMKADMDEDHIYWWNDTNRSGFNDLIAGSGASGGYSEAPRAKMAKSDPMDKFSDPTKELNYKWVRGQRWNKAGIGIVSKAIAAGSTLVQKEVAGVWTEGKGNQERRYLIAPHAMVDLKTGKYNDDGNAMRRHQMEFQDRERRVSEALAIFLDSKSGAPGDPKSMKLQSKVLKEFMNVYEEVEKDVWRPVTDGFDGMPEAAQFVEIMTAPFYNISSTTGKVYENGAQRNHKFHELLFKYGRYNAIMGEGVENKALNLSAYIRLGIRDHMMGDSKKYEDSYREALHGQRTFDAAKTFQIISSEEKLSRPSFYDAIGNTMAKLEGNMLSEFNRNFLTPDEMAAFKQGNNFLQTFDPTLRAARGGQFVANTQGLSNMIKADKYRERDHEDLLRYESARAQEMLSRGMDYNKETEKEQQWQKGKKAVPGSRYERFMGLNNYRDGVSIQTIRSLLARQDKNPGDAKNRVADAIAIRDFRDRRWAAYMNQQKFGTTPDQEISMDVMSAELEAKIAEYMDMYGKDGNEMVAFFDLLIPKSNGFFVDQGMSFTNYRKFPTDIYNAGMKMLQGGIAATGLSRQGQSINYTNIGVADVHRLMSYTASTMDMLLSGDRIGLHNVKSMVEAMEEAGMSVASALQARDVGRWDQRLNKMRTNVVRANLQMEGTDNGGVIKSIFGRMGDQRRTNQLLMRMADGETPEERRIKILQDWQGHANIGGFDKRYLDAMDRQALSGSWLMEISNAPVYSTDGFFAEAFKRDARRDISGKERKAAKQEDRAIDEDKIASMVHKREADFYDAIISSLNVFSSGGEPGRMPAKGTRNMKYDNIEDYVMAGRFNSETCK